MKTTTAKAPKVQRFTRTTNCLTDDNQVAVCTLTIKYLSDTKQDEWFGGGVALAAERLVDNYVAERVLYDVTTDRNMPKDLLKQLNKTVTDSVKSAKLKIKIDEVALLIKRDR